MTDPDFELVMRVARETVERIGPAFEEHERQHAAERQKLLVEADAVAEELDEHPLGSRDFKIPLDGESL